MLNLRRFSVVLLLLAELSAFSALAEKVSTMPAPTGCINDYAGVLTAPAKSEPEDLCRDLHDKTRAQLLVVTIKTLDGESVETFSNQLFHKWKIGEKKTDRGLLVLLAINDHQRRIEVGTGFEGLINDAKAGDIGREMVPNLKAADYDGAVRIGVDRLAQIVAADSNVTLDALAQPDSQPVTASLPEPRPQKNATWAAIAVITFMFSSMIAAFAFFAWRIKRAVKAGTFHPMRSSGGSSSSDDSSSDSSSSDDSFSGGDGGDSDGGGSSGSW